MGETFRTMLGVIARLRSGFDFRCPFAFLLNFWIGGSDFLFLRRASDSGFEIWKLFDSFISGVGVITLNYPEILIGRGRYISNLSSILLSKEFNSSSLSTTGSLNSLPWILYIAWLYYEPDTSKDFYLFVFRPLDWPPCKISFKVTSRSPGRPESIMSYISCSLSEIFILTSLNIDSN